MIGRFKFRAFIVIKKTTVIGPICYSSFQNNDDVIRCQQTKGDFCHFCHRFLFLDFCENGDHGHRHGSLEGHEDQVLHSVPTVKVMTICDGFEKSTKFVAQ